MLENIRNDEIAYNNCDNSSSGMLCFYWGNTSWAGNDVGFWACNEVVGSKWLENFRFRSEFLNKMIFFLDLGNFVTYHLTMEAERQGRNDIEVIQGFERISKINYKDYSVNILCN